MRAPWVSRWESARRYTMPTVDDDIATLYDATASDAADNLAASIYTLMTPPESLWLNLVPESTSSPDAQRATHILRSHLNDSNFYTTIHQCYMDLVVLGTACLFMSETPIGASSAFSFTSKLTMLPSTTTLTSSAEPLVRNGGFMIGLVRLIPPEKGKRNTGVSIQRLDIMHMHILCARILYQPGIPSPIMRRRVTRALKKLQRSNIMSA